MINGNILHHFYKKSNDELLFVVQLGTSDTVRIVSYDKINDLKHLLKYCKCMFEYYERYNYFDGTSYLIQEEFKKNNFIL
jgi:hypothetical protein